MQAVVYEGRDLEAMAFARNYNRWIISQAQAYLGREILEIGAGSGTFSRALQDIHHPVRHLAIEPSAEMFPLLKQAAVDAGFECRQGLLADSAAELAASFDSAVYVNVLEHVEHDAVEMTLACSVLRPGGHVFVYVPAHQTLYSNFDRGLGHFRRYTKATLRAVVEQAGLEVIKLGYNDLPGAFAWWTTFKLLGLSLGGGKVRLYDNVVVPVASRLERLIPPPFGKNVFVVARKPA